MVKAYAYGKRIKIHKAYKGVIVNVPEEWKKIIAKDPMKLTEDEIFKIKKAAYSKLGLNVSDEELKSFAKGNLAIKKELPEVFKGAIITDIAIATGNYDRRKKFFKPNKVVNPYFPSR